MKRIALLMVALALLPRLAFATSVNVSTVTVASGTVTVVTATNHGLNANTGVCLTSTAVCAVVATTANATTFTFAQPSNVSVANCAASCGTVTLAPKAIVLDVAQPNQAQQVIHYLLWLTTLTPLPKTGAASAWTAGAASVGASSAQNNALASGSFMEVNLTQAFPSSMTNAQIQAFLQNDYTTRQSALAANTQPGAFYGSMWDGIAWSVQ